MKTQINISNGSGWNNYPALKNNPSLPREVTYQLVTVSEMTQ